MLKVSSIVLGVSDLNKARPFYEEILGMTFEEFRPPFASATLGNIEFNIEENTEYRASDWAEKYIGGRKPIGFETDNLELFLTLASQKGAIVVETAVDRPWGWREAVIADGDGNEFVIEQKI